MLRQGALLLTALAVALAGCGGTAAEDDPVSAPTQETASEPTSDPSVERAPSVRVGESPVGVAAGRGDVVWVVSFGPSELARIPAGDAEPDLTVPAGSTPLRVLEAYDAVWISSFGSGDLVRADRRTGEETDRIPVGAGAEGVAEGFGSVWVVAQDAGELVRVDPDTRKVVDRIDIGEGARLVTAGPDAMWVGHFRDDKVLRVHPATGEVTASKKLCSGPQDLVALPDRVWVTCTFEDAVIAIDPRTLEETARVEVSGAPDPITPTDDGRLFVVAETGPTLHELDPVDGTVLASVVLGDAASLADSANLDVAVVGGEAWVSSVRENVVYHVPLP